MLAASRAVADAYWASDMGCQPGELRPREPRLQEHAGGLVGYQGAFILALDAAPVVSLPAAALGLLAAHGADFSANSVQDEPSLRGLLAPIEVTRVIGPALLAYADESCLRTGSTGDARALTSADEAAFLELKAACRAEDWEPKDFELSSPSTFGAFDVDGALCAVANFRIWAECIAHISVVAHPAARGQGYGTRSVSVAASAALSAGLLPQYRVLAENGPSRRIAEKLGFEPYGWSVVARFR